MRVFVTGATGFIGSALVPELIAAGHQVLGLARTDAGAHALTAAGAQVHRGHLEDLDSLRSGAAAADAVIHLAFIHDFSRFRENCAVDGKAIEALGESLAGSNRTLIVTGGLAALTQGRPATEDDAPAPRSEHMPRVSEATAAAFEPRGVRSIVVRLPQVHDTRKQGLVSYVIATARQQGVVPYVGEGANQWAAVHVSDAARLYRLALEKGRAGARYHAVAEEGVSARDMAETIGRRLNIPARSISPEQAPQYFGPLAAFAQISLTGSSAKTQHELGWKPTGPTLLTDLANLDLA
ncbi:MAG: SDR family oxidoreductase [Acidobacteriota bacterium]